MSHIATVKANWISCHVLHRPYCPRFRYPILHCCRFLYVGRAGLSKGTSDPHVAVQFVLLHRSNHRRRCRVGDGYDSVRLGMESTLFAPDCTRYGTDRDGYVCFFISLDMVTLTDMLLGSSPRVRATWSVRTAPMKQSRSSPSTTPRATVTPLL